MEDQEVRAITLDKEDQRTGLAIWRQYQKAHDLMHVAENDWQRWCNQMQALYAVPDGYQMTDIMTGFVPVQGENHG